MCGEYITSNLTFSMNIILVQNEVTDSHQIEQKINAIQVHKIHICVLYVRETHT